MRITILVLLLPLVCSCSIVKPIESSKIASIQNVGALSLLGEKLNIVQVGTTVFNNIHKYDSVPNWNIDNFALNEIRNQISARKGFNFVKMDYEYNEFVEIYKSTKRFPYADYDIKYVKDKLVGLRNKYGIDTLILVAKARRDASGNYHYIYGYSVYRRSLLGKEVKARYIFGADIAVIDMNDLKVLSKFPAYVRRDLEKGFWKKSISDYSEEELQLLQKYTKEIISSVIPRSLEKFGLVNP